MKILLVFQCFNWLEWLCFCDGAVYQIRCPISNENIYLLTQSEEFTLYICEISLDIHIRYGHFTFQGNFHSKKFRERVFIFLRWQRIQESREESYSTDRINPSRRSQSIPSATHFRLFAPSEFIFLPNVVVKLIVSVYWITSYPIFRFLSHTQTHYIT